MLLYIILLVSLVVFFIFGAFMGVIQTKRHIKADIDEKTRVEHFMYTSFGLWVPVIAIFLVVAFSDITFYDIGFRLPDFAQNELHIVVTVIAYAVAILWTCYIFYQIIAFFVSPKYRERKRKSIEKDLNSDDIFKLANVKLMLPGSNKEKLWFTWLSFAAGFCEEVIFRGVFIFLMVSIFPGLSMYWIVAILVVLFGLGHFYQGVKGIIYTGAVGALFMLMYISSGSLLFVIILHFLIDFAHCFHYSEE